MSVTSGIQLSDVELVSHILGNAPNINETSGTQTSETTGTQKLGNMDGSENPENADGFENTERNGRNGTGADDPNIAAMNDSQMDTAQNAQDAKPSTPEQNAGLGFLDYLKSPIVEISVGQGDDETVLTAHQSLLLESPFLAEEVSKFDESGSRRFIKLQDENVDAFGCFLQFLYTRDYASKQAEGQVDDSGEQLLKHARVHTLAGKLGIPNLKTLAHSKIHRVRSSPRGELEYARYVYAHTTTDDAALRKPIARFWATRSHELRLGIEEEFKSLCLEAPEFSYDVLILVLDNKQKHGHEKADRIEVDPGSRPNRRKRQKRAQ